MGIRRYSVVFFVGLTLLTGCTKPAKADGTTVAVGEGRSKSNGSFIQNDMKNVEQRDYATVILIAKGTDGKRYHMELGIAQEKRVGEKSQTEEVSGFDCDNLTELAESYQSVKGKDLSLSHLKVILLGEMGEARTVLKPQTLQAGNSRQIYPMEELQELLFLLDENREIAKTCPVLQMEESGTFLQYMREAEEPVGTYLSSLIEAGEKQGEDIPWLKDYLKAVREGDGLTIYCLESVEEGWILRCGAIWKS